MLHLVDDTRKSVRDVLFVRRNMHQLDLDLVDQGVREVELAQRQGRIRRDDEDVVDKVDGCMGLDLQKGRHNESCALDDLRYQLL